MRRIPLRRHDGTVRAYATVDDEDYEWLSQWRWCLTGGYAARVDLSHGDRRTVLMHRVLLGLDQDDPRRGDHRNRKTRDNRRQNLRVAVRGQADNMQNQSVRVTSRSGYRGVSFDKSRGKWRAHATLNGRTRSLGYHDTAEDANDMVVAWRALHMPFSEDAVAA
jgi:hypothetical protein